MDGEGAPGKQELSPIVGVAFEYRGTVYIGKPHEEHVDLRERLAETVPAFASEAIFDDPDLKPGWGTADGQFLTDAQMREHLRQIDAEA